MLYSTVLYGRYSCSDICIMHTRQWSRPKKATYGLFTFEFVSDEVIYFYADPDPHQTLHSETNPDPDPDPDPNPDPTQSLAHVGK
jgi:hypothetical protein